MKLSRVMICWLVLMVTVAGAAVMALELLGARLLSVGFGASSIVWGAIISVTLLSLAAGSFFGGHIADRRPKPGIVAGLVLCASALIAVIPHLRCLLGACYRAMGVRWGALAGALAIFLIPLMLLGMITPFVIRLMCGRRERLGATAGGLYAVSTVGGVIGTLVTAFWLIPEFGLSFCFRLASFVVALTGAVGLVICFGLCGSAGLLIVLGLAFMPRVIARAGASWTAPDGERVAVEFEKDSRYGRIAVLTKGDYRMLMIDGIMQTGMPEDMSHLLKGRPLMDRCYQELIPYAVEDPEESSALVIGLAGGLTPSILERYGMAVDCVELDPAVVETAKQWFGFEGTVVTGDGRWFLETCERQYDFCVIDTYSGDACPFHMLSFEAFLSAKRVLNAGGILVVNFIGAPQGAAFGAVYRTICKVFSNVLAVKSEAGDDVQAIVVFASDRTIEFNNGWLAYLGDFSGEDPVAAAVARLTVESPPECAYVLTDDFNPVDMLRAGEAIRWRERTVKELGSEGLF